jgi:hypothetical protein
MRVDKGHHNGSGGILVLEGIRGIVGIFVRLEGINWSVEEGDFSVMAENRVAMEVESRDMLIHICRGRDQCRENSLDEIITQIRWDATVDSDSAEDSCVDVGMDSILVGQGIHMLGFD